MEHMPDTDKMGCRRAERSSISKTLLNELLMDLAPAKRNAVEGGLQNGHEIELQATKGDSTVSLLSKNYNFISSSLSSLGSKLKSGIVAKQTHISGGSGHDGGKCLSTSFLHRLSNKESSVSRVEGSTSSLYSSKSSLGAVGSNSDRIHERPLAKTPYAPNADEVQLKGLGDCAQWAVSLNATGYVMDGETYTVPNRRTIGIQRMSLSENMSHSLRSLNSTTLRLSEGTTRRSITQGHGRRTKNVGDSASSTSNLSASSGRQRDGMSCDQSTASFSRRQGYSSSPLSQLLSRSKSPTPQGSRRSGFSGRQGDAASIASKRSSSAGRWQRQDGMSCDRSTASLSRRRGSLSNLSRLSTRSTSPTTQGSRRSGFSGRQGDAASTTSKRSCSAGRRQRQDGMSCDRSTASLSRRRGSLSSLSRLPSRSTSPTTQVSRRCGFSGRQGDAASITSKRSCSAGRRQRQDGMSCDRSTASLSRRRGSLSSLSRLPSRSTSPTSLESRRSGLSGRRGGSASITSNRSASAGRRRDGIPSNRSITASCGSGRRGASSSSLSRLPSRSTSPTTLGSRRSGFARKRGDSPRSRTSRFSSSPRRSRRDGTPSDRSTSTGSCSRRPRPSSSALLPTRKGGGVSAGRHPRINSRSGQSSKNSLTLSRHQKRSSSNPSLKPLLQLLEQGSKPQPEANQQDQAADPNDSAAGASSSANASWGGSEDPPTTSADILHQSLPDLSKLLGWDQEDANESKGSDTNFQAMANASWDFGALVRQNSMGEISTGSPSRNIIRPTRVALKSGRYSSLLGETTTPPLTIVLSDRQKQIITSLIELENDLLAPTEA